MNERDFTLLRDWQGQNPSGWYQSEKLDGVRAYFDGARLWTRGGHLITAPAWFTRRLPAGVHLDGEIYAGRSRFEEARRAVQYGQWTRRCRFVAFDCPQAAGTYAQRIAAAESHYADVVAVKVCPDRASLITDLNRIQSRGGEGLVIRSPHADRYEAGRTSNSLKVKYIVA
jgi:DNA ligase-1